jgi:cobalt-zinc-cadmium efflux system outer membrane protein
MFFFIRLCSLAVVGALFVFAVRADDVAGDGGRLTLQQAEALWRAHSHEVKLAGMAVGGAGADAVAAEQRPNPVLSLGVSSLSHDPGIGSGGLRDKMMDSVVGLSQTFERGDKRALRMANAKWKLAAAREDLADTLRAQRMTLVEAYYGLKLAQETNRIATDYAALYQHTRKAAELRLKAGDLAGADVMRLRVEALRAQNDAIAAAAGLAQAKVALAYLIGREHDADRLEAVDAWPDFTATPGMATDIAQRADVRAASERERAAEAARDLARAQKSRDVNVGVSFEHNPTGSGWASNSYGVAVSFPLLWNYAYEGEIGRAESDLSAAEENLAMVRAQAVADLARVASDLAGARERARHTDAELVNEARKAADAAEFAFAHGAMGVMDLLDARRTFKATQLEAVRARADYAAALAAYRAASEGSTAKEERP